MAAQERIRPIPPTVAKRTQSCFATFATHTCRAAPEWRPLRGSGRVSASVMLCITSSAMASEAIDAASPSRICMPQPYFHCCVCHLLYEYQLTSKCFGHHILSHCLQGHGSTLQYLRARGQFLLFGHARLVSTSAFVRASRI